MIKKNDLLIEEEENLPEYWSSFSDMMSGLLMIFILFLTITILQLNIQEDLLHDKEVLLQEKEDEVNRILGVRQMIVEQLRKEFEDSELQLNIDPETGSITFSEGVFFDYDKYDIKDTGKNYLKSFIPKYIEVLLNENNRQYISEIIIEGHTDNQGSYMYNLELSQKRAFEVVKYILSDEFGQLTKEENEVLKSMLTANGRSFSNPIMKEDRNIDVEKSRRVEFKFRLKDEEMIYQMQDLLGDENAK